MPRPANVTDEDIATWEEQRLAYVKENKSFINIPPEVWWSGEWLANELHDLGCEDELGACICEATGQRQCYSKDHWQTAQEAVDKYKQGLYEKPGVELAEQLIKEKYGQNPDPQEILADLLNQGADAGFLMEKLVEKDLGKIKIVKRKE